MNKRILLPTDFSKNALNAVRYAVDLYRDVPCDFYFLNAFRISGYSIDSLTPPEPGDIAYESARKESEAGLARLLELLDLHNDNPRHEYHTIATYNSLLYAIQANIAQYDIDLVVMGTKGITGAESLIFGTNTINVMEGVTECPVLAVPQDYRYTQPREIVFPTDFKATYKRRELNYMLEIAKLHQAFIRVLHIKKESRLSREQESNRELLAAILEDSDHSFHTLEDIKVHKGIGAFVESRESDMVAFINRKHTFLGKILSKPLVNELGYHYNMPLLALNDHR
ncbi:universal stress protein [Lentiprolixibacter aurantiacus]|uniref:Universal stress protein n=1 Tax=Lentiprolixibacter aurantiacus TaxID=2993939 RepID=A0AAE3SP06_9FLAO|nr:universal stress protein [Lentiprolixibacter aurantiacus]MCX2720105.1 universal stress protein [Lentiprolixibacter aurantiacus]